MTGRKRKQEAEEPTERERKGGVALHQTLRDKMFSSKDLFIFLGERHVDEKWKMKQLDRKMKVKRHIYVSTRFK